MYVLRGEKSCGGWSFCENGRKICLGEWWIVCVLWERVERIWEIIVKFRRFVIEMCLVVELIIFVVEFIG